jgi:hypothetical protein
MSELPPERWEPARDPRLVQIGSRVMPAGKAGKLAAYLHEHPWQSLLYYLLGRMPRQFRD